MKAGNYGSLIISASIFYAALTFPDNRVTNFLRAKFALKARVQEGPVQIHIYIYIKKETCSDFNQISVPTSKLQVNFSFLLSSSFSTSSPAEMNVASAETDTKSDFQ